MGQKIHPGGLRVGVIHDWKSNWYTGKKEFPQYLLEDVRIREHIYKKLSHAGLSDILIRKDKQRITVDIYTARPGIVIGKSGVEVDALRKELHALTQKNVHININEIKRPELDAKLVAQSIAEQLSNRVAFRRAMKRALASAIRSGAAGVKIQCSGRLGGGEMSRRETYNEGRVPLHTIRADIDYGFVEAQHGLGPHRRQGLDQQGRDHAGGLRQRRERRRRAARRPGRSPPSRRRDRGSRRLARERPRARPGPRGPRAGQAPARPGRRRRRRRSRRGRGRGAGGGGRRAVPGAGARPAGGGGAGGVRRAARPAAAAAAARASRERREAAHRRQRAPAEGREQPVIEPQSRDAEAGRRRARHDDAEATPKSRAARRSEADEGADS